MKNLGTNENKDNEVGLTPNLRGNPFSVPENYFQSLERDILFNTKIIKDSDAAFSTPPDYQIQLTDDILARTSEEKLRSTLKTDGFSVPNGYFNELKNTLIEQTGSQSKVIPFKKSKRVWVSYAAASIALAVSMFAWFQQDQPNNEVDQKQLVNINTLPTEEIIDYLAFYTETGDIITLSNQLPDRFEGFTETLSTDEIELYLKNSI